MDVTSARPNNEATALLGSLLQTQRFSERKQREAQSVVRNDVVYFSPVIKVDPDTKTAIIQYRDAVSGEVENQYPSNKQIDSYKQARLLEKQEFVLPVVSEPPKEAPSPVDQEA